MVKHDNNLMKVWINGANGLVGKSLLHVSQKYKKFEIVSTSREDLDLFDLKKIKHLFKRINLNTLFIVQQKLEVFMQIKINHLITFMRII